ncbi:hypothetical protein ACVWYN_001603 [Pedobacter sp. UYP24]
MTIANANALSVSSTLPYKTTKNGDYALQTNFLTRLFFF